MCGDQMALYNEILPEFREYGAELLGISVDGVWCHKAFAEHRKLRSGVNGTPTFFVNGVRHDAGWDEETLAENARASGAMSGVAAQRSRREQV